MGKTLAYDFVKNEIGKEGYELLSSKYLDSVSKLSIQCPKGHRYQSSRNSWKKGRRCPYCSGVYIDPALVRQAFEKEGYTLLDEYEQGRSSTKKLRFICSKGHCQSIRWGNWAQGNRCLECANRIITIEKVRKEVQNVGFQLISENYEGANSYLEIKCNKGHSFAMRWSNFNTGYRCPKCRKNAPLNYNDVKKKIEKEGYRLLSKTYTNCLSFLLFECPNKHQYEAKWTSFQAGHRCRICNADAGFNCDKPGWIYYLKINIESKIYYKIGVTNKSIKSRIRHIPYSCKILWQEPYLFGIYAYQKEQELLNKFKIFRNNKHFNFSGYSEMFLEDVLKKDL
ncbi:MAG: hypothetical protein ACRCVT_01250 [Leadbetterella sp.]